MGTVENAPLLEAIFELRWGQAPNGDYDYSPDDQSLFVGKLSALAHDEGIVFTEQLGSPPFPHSVTHRYRVSEGTWPCYQAGLGIFTVNQINDGYSSDDFKQAIRKGLEIFDKSGPDKLLKNRDSLVVILRYQDALFPADGMSVQDFVSDRLHISAALPSKFLAHDAVDNEVSSMRCQFNCATTEPKGEIVVKVSNAIIDNKPGFIAETLVVSQAASELEDLSVDSIMNWVGKAHLLQRHSFETIIDEEAYR
ncbi:TIGR04255 family protein [Neptunomonas marina]|uniref:TIGR04255 family protein n=1 Tax=Neptunomonas marina TaxID=1815562 RepID=A0A437Q6T6_9GAMM|nr:TIGR04255 family protein [Neptunomonas marina]RVU30231.1 TIGR04255 family protein [Neptunomonas marina]